MKARTKKLTKPCKTASFKEYITYYMQRKGWSQATLAGFARLNQSTVNKVINGNYYRTNFDIFICLFLALQLTVEESADLLSRAERAFSPASKLHDAYQKLIACYVWEKFDSTLPSSERLDRADDYLIKRGFPPLPNNYLKKKK